MRKCRIFLFILPILLFVFVTTALAFPGPVFVLLYHPGEEGFESAFRGHLNWLKENGYQTISLETLMSYLKGEEVPLPPKPIVLTFDDGDIENYTIAYPMLQEFADTGITFVITGRSFLRYSERSWWREVDRSGVLDVEDHSWMHGLIWTGPNIIDFYSGEDPGDYFLIKGIDWRLGVPIYEYDEELVNRRYLPDRRIANLCVDYVAKNGGQDFFKREGWKDELFQVVETFRDQRGDRGTFESDEERNERLRKELYRSKTRIERTIGRGKRVKFFAYPWGAYDEALILQLKAFGYQGGLTSDDWDGNFPGDDPFKIKRLTVPPDMTVEDLAEILNDPSSSFPAE